MNAKLIINKFIIIIYNLRFISGLSNFEFLIVKNSNFLYS